jgi:hypothetical protein
MQLRNFFFIVPPGVARANFDGECATVIYRTRCPRTNNQAKQGASALVCEVGAAGAGRTKSAVLKETALRVPKLRCERTAGLIFD